MEKEIAQKHKNHLVKKTILRTVEKDDSLEIKLNAGEELIVKRIFEKGADGGYYDTLYVYLNGQEISALGQCSSLTIKLSKGDELIVQRQNELALAHQV